MKARAILLASVLLVGCQASKHDGTVEQRAQSLSAAGQGEAGKFTSQARWLDDGTLYAQDQDLWTSISDELKMGIPENPRGALGHGLPVAVGLALAAKKSNSSRRIFLITGLVTPASRRA